MAHSGRHNVRLSRSLSLVLRHRAPKMGFQIFPGGYLLVRELLAHRMFNNCTEEDIRQVVALNDKQRFSLKEDPATGDLLICANQGHSFEVQDQELEAITNAADYPTVVHGTYFRNWESIQRQGLKRMKRTYIHFAKGEPGADGVISGMRKSCEMMIFLDLQAALEDGLKFFVSKNGVILCPGSDQGVVSPAYFSRVLQVRPRQELPFQRPQRPR
ncbi:tRNA 2'-phosphotransferase 1-like [Diadema setosum]|uniref:tRNA 2'-phosphotransferase 1-like n=1 Tax=Diadema setosum TaxID=31175 RepID=UPI003B3A12EE